MNATLSTPSLASALPASSTKPLWAAVGVLSVCVLAMGATLVHVNKRAEPLAQAAIPLSSAMAMNIPAAPAASGAPVERMTEEKTVAKPTAAVAKTTHSAPQAAKQVMPAVDKTTAVTPAPAPQPVVIAQAPSATPQPAPAPEVASGVPAVGAASPSPAPVVVAQAPAKPACISCGTVEAVTPVTRPSEGSGVGVIAGGVLGGVVGNQMGKGTGRAATTILGAIGGGWAGNAIEKNMKKTTLYSVRVRMEDGTSRTIEQSSAPMVGSKVTLDGGALRPA
jgi:outer membrane lipoprotein SlyB